MPFNNSILDALASIPTPQVFFIETPLYKAFAVGDDAQSQEAFWQVHNPTASLDTWCKQCSDRSIFRPVAIPRPRLASGYAGIFINTFRCSRNEKHDSLIFVVHIADDVLTKIGQQPSLADLQIADTRKYRPLLGDMYPEFTKAIGLAAHGVGIGSFVYLRRIFERLVEEAHVDASHSGAWNDDAYSKSRMSEKVTMLGDRLPEFLRDSPALYALLSKGIHELAEEECIAAFQLVRTSIELILDQHHEQKQRLTKVQEAKSGLARLMSSTKSPDRKGT